VSKEPPFFDSEKKDGGRGKKTHQKKGEPVQNVESKSSEHPSLSGERDRPDNHWKGLRPRITRKEKWKKSQRKGNLQEKKGKERIDHIETRLNCQGGKERGGGHPKAPIVLVKSELPGTSRSLADTM